MRDDLPSGTVTFLLTDIEGSTRLLHDLGDQYARVLADHRDIMRGSAAAHGGVEVDTQGDAFFIAFPDAIGCVRAAVAVQRALEGHAWPEGGRVRVRMGVHTGEATRTDEGYVGMDVHAAARICSSGHGGQVLLSERTAGLVEQVLNEESITLRDLGEHALKDLEGNQHLYQVVIPELQSDFSPLRSLETAPNNLPTSPTPFIGRAKEVAAVRDLVLRNGVRVVTLTGAGGTGKSRLGLRVATELLHSFKDGAFYVPLAPVRTPDLVPSAIARALGVREGQGRTLLEALEEFLREKELLLLLDNFEHVRQGARALAQLMTQCPLVKVLITSREVLRLSGEHGFPVPPLGLPEPGRMPPVEQLQSYEAVRLFVERAEAALPGFGLDAETAPAVVEICRRLDGLPLALELAAAQVDAMAPAQLLEALESRLSVLTDGPIDLPERQQTLRDAIGWSYDLLEPAEQKLCRRLAVFAGGCTLDAAQEVCDLEGDLDLAAGTEALVDKNLLGREFSSAAGADKVLQQGPSPTLWRFAMLQTIREYATERLEESGELPALRTRHQDWCVRMTAEAEPELRAADAPLWLDRLDDEHDNIRAALGRALESGEGAETALRICASLLVFWYHHGFFSEGRDWLDRALEVGQDAPADVRAKALYGAAGMARYLGDEAAAVEYAEAAIEIYRSLDDKAGLAQALAERGANYEENEDTERARQVLDEALSIFRELGQRERTAFTLNMLANLAMDTGDHAAAARLLEESLEISREDRDRNNHLAGVLNLAEVRRLEGDDVGAVANLQEALPLIVELRQRHALAYCLEMIAGLDAASGSAVRAARLFGAAEALREELGSPVSPANLERYRRDVDSVRKLLDDAAFQEAWAAGRRLDTDEVTKEAMRPG